MSCGRWSPGLPKSAPTTRWRCPRWRCCCRMRARREAMQKLQQAISASGQSIHFRLYDAMQSVAEALLAEGQLLACAIAVVVPGHARSKRSRAAGGDHAAQRVAQYPAAVEAGSAAGTGCGRRALEGRFRAGHAAARQRALAGSGRAIGSPAGQRPATPRRSGATWERCGRGWPTRNGSAAAFEKYATLDVPLEDAVEAEALSRLLGEDPLGDESDVLSVAYPVKDYGAAEAALNALPHGDRHSAATLFDGREEGPRPKAGYFLIDRPQPAAWQDVALDKVPRMLAQLLLYGKETDRLARAKLVAISAPRFDTANKLIWDALGNELEGAMEQNVAGRISASRELLRDDAYLPANAVPHEEADRLATQLLRNSLLHDWTERPLGLLDGKTPRQAAAEPHYRVKVLAAIFILQSWSEIMRGEAFDFNLLRSELGLPTLAPSIRPRRPSRTSPWCD